MLPHTGESYKLKHTAHVTAHRRVVQTETRIELVTGDTSDINRNGRYGLNKTVGIV